MKTKLLAWGISLLLFASIWGLAKSGAMVYRNVSKDKIYARDGAKRSKHYRSSYYGGAYRYGK